MTSKSDLKAKGAVLKATLQIGKAGMTEGLENELRSQLEKRELVKVKLLQTGPSKEEWSGSMRELSSKLGAEVIEVKGGTMLLYKQKGRKR